MLLFGISSLALGLVPPLPSVDRTWPSSLNTHIVRGIRGAVAEAHELGGLKGGSIAAGRIARLCAQELLFFPHLAVRGRRALEEARWRRR